MNRAVRILPVLTLMWAVSLPAGAQLMKVFAGAACLGCNINMPVHPRDPVGYSAIAQTEIGLGITLQFGLPNGYMAIASGDLGNASSLPPNGCIRQGGIIHTGNFVTGVVTSYNAPGTYSVTLKIIQCDWVSDPTVPGGINMVPDGLVITEATGTVTVVPAGGGGGGGGNCGNQPGQPSLVDPIATSLLNGTSITTDVTKLQGASQVVQGVSADGITEVAIRIPAACAGDSFTVSLPNGSSNNDDGGLSSINDQTSFSNSVTVAASSTPGGPMAFAVYQAPLNYLRASDDPTRGVRVESLQIQSNSNSNSPSSLNIFVYRPPVVLVHGLWGNPNGWSNFSPLVSDILTPIANLPFYVQAAAYDIALPNITTSSTPSYRSISGVSANALGFAFNAPTINSQIRQAIQDFKQVNNVAAVQADVVAHSMGGDIMRTVASLPTFLSDDTYGLGPVDKLITIGTPHLGSPLAIQLLQDQGSNSNTCVRKVLAYKGQYSFLVVQFSDQTTAPGAAGDLRGDGTGSNLSPALTAFHGVPLPFPIAYISGTENAHNLSTVDCTKDQNGNTCGAQSLRSLCGGFPFHDPLADNLHANLWEPVIFAGQHSDSVVPLNSQLDGRAPGSAFTFTFDGLIHSDAFEALNFLGPAELDPQANSNQVPQKIIDLLNESSMGQDFQQ